LRAYDERLSISPRAKKGEIFAALNCHVIAEAELEGRYGIR
jgi:hypothetical protein